MKQWQSYTGFIWAMVGAAIGLGQIWKLPYAIGDSGGSAFLLVYMLATLLVGLPALLAEMSVGQLAPDASVPALRTLIARFQTSHVWVSLGWWGLIILLLILSFYAVVAGWSLAYMQAMCFGDLQGADASQITAYWQQLMASPMRMLLFHSIFLGSVLLVVSFEVTQGIERICRWFMPLLGIFFMLLLIKGVFLGGGGEAVHFLFHLDLSRLTPDIIIAAIGHACFTLAIGSGCMQLYGAYMPRAYGLVRSAVVIVLLNWCMALLIALALFSLVYGYQLLPKSGPGLIFEVLPMAFSHMWWGSLWGALFFTAVFIAAWTSAVSLAEPVIVYFVSRGYSRSHASVMLGCIAWILGLGCVFSFNIGQDLFIFGHWTWFTVLTDLTTHVMLPLGVLAYAVFVGWVLPSDAVKFTLAVNRSWVFYGWLGLIRFLVPLAILSIMIHSLVHSIGD